jgi:hypothetical protein
MGDHRQCTCQREEFYFLIIVEKQPTVLAKFSEDSKKKGEKKEANTKTFERRQREIRRGGRGERLRAVEWPPIGGRACSGFSLRLPSVVGAFPGGRFLFCCAIGVWTFGCWVVCATLCICMAAIANAARRPMGCNTYRVDCAHARDVASKSQSRCHLAVPSDDNFSPPTVCACTSCSSRPCHPLCHAWHRVADYRAALLSPFLCFGVFFVCFFYACGSSSLSPCKRPERLTVGRHGARAAR